MLALSLLTTGLAAPVATPERIIMKFGGSSVRDAERITEVCKLCQMQIDNGMKPHMVCSAMGSTTNNLLKAADMAISDNIVDLSAVTDLHRETAETLGFLEAPAYLEVVQLLDECKKTLEGVAMLGELSTRTRDRIVSYGERCSGRMVAACLEEMGTPAVQIESWDLGLTTSSKFGDASVLDSCWPTLKEKIHAISDNTVAVITGFIGKDSEGSITTLGRGGSDLTASLLGAAAGYDEVQVWKDVDGILSADPRVVGWENAVPVPFVSYTEAAELAYFGAKVLHPVAMQPAVKTGLPVRVKNSYNPEAAGTLITSDFTQKGPVSAITSKSEITVVDIQSTRMLGSYGFLSQVFESFKRHKLSVDVVATSEVSVSLTLNKPIEILSKVQEGPINQQWAANVQDNGLRSVIEDLDSCSTIDIKPGRSIITLIANVKESSSVMATVFEVLNEMGVQVEMISQGASKVNISLVIPGEHEKAVIKALHACFFEDACMVPLLGDDAPKRGPPVEKDTPK